jgi:hypothetical protein
MRRVILSLAAAVVAAGCGERDVAPRGPEATGFPARVLMSVDPAPAILSGRTLGLLGSPLGQGPLLAASALAPESPEPANPRAEALQGDIRGLRRRPNQADDGDTWPLGRRRPNQADGDNLPPGRRLNQADGHIQEETSDLPGRARTSEPTRSPRSLPSRRPPVRPPGH